ncbi:MAG: HD domain-containing protein [Firmicutes bacterium]|nr:HD domain-containing protein [Bacillota bacterium]
MMEKDMFLEVQSNFLNKEKNLSPYACLSEYAIRIYPDNDETDIRPAFYHDIDRIIHAMSYTRYLNKTQVFSFQTNDHISKRIVHVQLVSKIARTIGRALNLNEDLIEAIALGHDIGHTPIGHVGESILNELSLRETGMMFNHNIQSVRTYMNLENNQKGMNLTIQVLDGIMCHNGEMVTNIYRPLEKTKEAFIEEYENCYIDKKRVKELCPMTLEGCVVRISDIIGYIGRDIEDAIHLGVLKRKEIPESIKQVLGTTNKEIVNTIIMDIIKNSLDKPYIKMSQEVYQAIVDLKDFNYKNIYNKANSPEQIEFYRQGMNDIYYHFLNDLEKENKESDIYKVYLNYADSKYLEESNKRIVIDFIAGMTDEYFLNCIHKLEKEKC